MRPKILKAALAGLLHDIGKFAQRAQKNPWDRPSGFTDDKEVYGENGFHALWSAWFAKTYVDRDWLVPFDVLTHHNPQSEMAELVSLADWLSAGERDKPAETERVPQLVSIFCNLGEEGAGDLYWPLTPLRLDRKVVFPSRQLAPAARESGYRLLYEEFLTWAEKARDIRDLVCFIEQYMGLLQRYTWCVPSAFFGSKPDVSLYDHSRMTAALAACLAVLPSTEIRELRGALRSHGVQPDPQGEKAAYVVSEKQVARLVAGDISGIQAFIYTISSKGATSALRGRSAYLQLLAEAVARYVLRRLELPITNLIYAGGGHFFLLVPPGAETEEQLTGIQREITRVLFAAHKGDIYLALDSVPVSAAELQGQAFSHKWTEVGWKVSKAKQRRFSELGADLYQLFEPPEHGGDKDKICAVCHREHPQTGSAEGEVNKCPACRSFEELGGELRRVRVIRLDEIELVERPEGEIQKGTWQEVLRALGLAFKFDVPHQAVSGAQRSLLWVLRDDEFDTQHLQDRLAVVRRLWVNVTPVLTATDIEQLKGKVELRGEALEDGNIKSFSVLEAQATGIQRLGVLRLDLDDTGRLFTIELGERATLSRRAALSFALSLYFDGWVGMLAEKFNQVPQTGGNRIYSIYSGGDDLFFIGSWDVIPQLAVAIRDDLVKYTGGHPRVHASAGIALVSGKYPLYMAAQDAGTALEAAKSYSGKNAVNFLGRSVPWEIFVDEMKPCVENWVSLFETGMCRSFTRRLMELHAMYERHKQDRRKMGLDIIADGREQLLWGPWMWQGNYLLKRLERSATQPVVGAEIARVADRLIGDFRSIDWIGLAARWADLLGRKDPD